MKKITLFWAVLMMMFAAIATPVSKEEAAIVCKNFLSYKAVNNAGIPFSFNYYKTEYLGQTPVYHIFTLDATGFVIVAASNCFNPIVAYSFESDFQNNPEFDFAMNAYAHRISYYEKEAKAARPDVAEKWQKWQNPNFLPEQSRAAVVAPLLTSKWNQDHFFNTYCPYDVNSRTRCITGCVATAMSQVMNYYSHPLSGLRGTSYIPSGYERITIFFRDQTYNFHAMPNSPSNYANEMAKLIYHCGVAVQMNYSPSESGAYSVTASDALKNFFKYTPDIWLCPRALFDSIDTWHNVLKSELDLRRPLYYSATGQQMTGHAFVVDGYDDQTLFHVNWGWGGACDGYFTISDNNPDDMMGYIYDAEIIRNCFPGQDAPTPCTGFTRIDAATGRFNSGLPTANYSPNSDCSWMLAAPEASKYVLHFDRLNTESNTDIVTIYNGPTINSGVAAQVSGTTIPADIFVIADSVLITFTSNESNEFPGFQISFSATTENPYCSDTTITAEGTTTIEDGSGNAPYRNNTTCQWDINTPGMHHFYLSFTDYELGSGEYIDIYDATVNPPRLYRRFDNDHWPASVETCNFGKGVIRFVSDNWDTGNGFSMTCETVTSVNDHARISDLHIYPNPSNNILNINFITPTTDHIVCRLVDMNGKTLINRNYTHHGGLFNETFNVGNYASGIYFLHIRTSEGTTTEKIVIN